MYAHYMQVISGFAHVHTFLIPYCCFTIRKYNYNYNLPKFTLIIFTHNKNIHALISVTHEMSLVLLHMKCHKFCVIYYTYICTSSLFNY